MPGVLANVSVSGMMVGNHIGENKRVATPT